jgi:hypothetical protein
LGDPAAAGSCACKERRVREKKMAKRNDFIAYLFGATKIDISI